MSGKSERPVPPPAAVEHEADILQAIRDTRFGTVEIVVHQSRVVQITRSEKFRFERTSPDLR